MHGDGASKQSLQSPSSPQKRSLLPPPSELASGTAGESNDDGSVESSDSDVPDAASDVHMLSEMGGSNTEQGEDPRGTFVGTLFAGESFGQLALTENSGRRSSTPGLTGEDGSASDVDPSQAQKARFRRVTISTKDESSVFLVLSRKQFKRTLDTMRKAMLDTTKRFLRKLALFEACSDEELTRISDTCEHRRYRSGHEVIKQGVRLEGIVLIRRGRCLVKQVVRTAAKPKARNEVEALTGLAESQPSPRTPSMSGITSFDRDAAEPATTY